MNSSTTDSTVTLHVMAQSYLSSPLFIIITTFLLQIGSARVIRHYLETRLSKSHRFHAYTPDMQRRIFAQPETLMMKTLVIYYAFPLVRYFLESLYSRELFPWTPKHHITLDSLISILASIYLFDVSHQQSSIPYFIHHYVSLMCALAVRVAPSSALTGLFVPFFFPGIICGDFCGEVIWLMYRLAPYREGVVTPLRIFCFGHLASRILQWLLILSYILIFHGDIAGTTGWIAVPFLMGVLAYWAWCERFYVILGFNLTRDFGGHVKEFASIHSVKQYVL